MSETVGARLGQAIAAQDEAAIAECFCRDATFRALTPSGVKERGGADETAALIAAWFGDSTVIDLVDTRTDEVGGRLQVTYRFEGVEEGQPTSSSRSSSARSTTARSRLATSFARAFFRPRRPARTDAALREERTLYAATRSG
jgi:hypothetical protein